MKKYHFILLLLLGIFFTPNAIYACGSHSEKNTSKKEITEKSKKDSCCDSECHSKTKNQNGCSGKCKHNSCNCITPIVSLILPSLSELNSNNNFALFNKKKSFIHKESNIASGFYYIWTPPNIG